MSESRPLRGARLIRILNRVLPLRRHYSRLVRLLNREGVLEVPYAGGRVLIPAEWSKSVASHFLWQQRSLAGFELLKPVLRNLDHGTIVDVGANLGYFVLIARRKSAQPILCFEPEPRLAGLLKQTVALNRLEDVEVRAVACGNVFGELQIGVGENAVVRYGGDMRHSNRVPVLPLDHSLRNTGPISLLRVDCEGYEAQALEGASRILLRDRPSVFVELHPHFLARYGKRVDDVIDLLAIHESVRAWIDHRIPPARKFRRSLRKFFRPKFRELADLDAVRALCASGHAPSQIFLLATSPAAA